MSKAGETFFTVVGCMDGRVQNVMAEFGRKKFKAIYPDTITEAGIVGGISNKPTKTFIDKLAFKLIVSVEKHNSVGILVDGHQECAGNPVDDKKHIQDIVKSVKAIKKLTKNKVPVIGLFVQRDGENWIAREI